VVILVQEGLIIVTPIVIVVLKTTMTEEIHQVRVKVEEEQETAMMVISELRDLKVSTDRLQETGKWTVIKKKVALLNQQRKIARHKDSILRMSLRATTRTKLLKVTEED
jgi:hypothetical protein